MVNYVMKWIDRLVVGLLDDASLSEKMQLDPELTLDKALSMAWHSEAVHNQQPVVRGTAQHNDLSKYLNHKECKPSQTSPLNYHTRSKQQQTAKCSRCGKSPRHVKQQCPARASICKKSNNIGH